MEELNIMKKMWKTLISISRKIFFLVVILCIFLFSPLRPFKPKDIEVVDLDRVSKMKIGRKKALTLLTWNLG